MNLNKKTQCNFGKNKNIQCTGHSIDYEMHEYLEYLKEKEYDEKINNLIRKSILIVVLLFVLVISILLI